MQVRYASTISFYRRIVYGHYNYPDSFCFVSLPTRVSLSYYSLVGRVEDHEDQPTMYMIKLQFSLPQ